VTAYSLWIKSDN